MDEMLAHFEACLDDLGVANKVVPALPTLPGLRVAKVHLTRGGSDQDYALLYGPAVRLADAGRAGEADLPTLVFATFVAPKTAETFRRAGVQYLDTVGNAWIKFGDVLIDVRGRSRPDGAAARSHVGAGNLFSTGRAQVVFALLAWPRLWEAPRREVAHAAGVSLGQAHNALTLLAESGYGSERAHAHQTELLDLWAAAFPTGLAKKLTLATYRGDIGTVKKASADDPVFVSGESAADELLRPATLTLYVRELDPRLPIVNKWRSDGPANIVVRRKFWHAPDSSDAPLAGGRPAPWPLVYADLVNSDDPRARNVAKEWRGRFAGPEQHS
jgi:hypothetical protein